MTCRHGTGYYCKRPCSLVTVLKEPFAHFMYHVRDELMAIRLGAMVLKNGRIINTNVRQETAKKYNTDFCPACHQIFPGPKQVRDHMVCSIECSKSARCNDCTMEAEPRLECTECAELCRKLICRTYLELATQMGYCPPVYLELFNSADEEAVQRDLDERETDSWVGGGR